MTKRALATKILPSVGVRRRGADDSNF